MVNKIVEFMYGNCVVLERIDVIINVVESDDQIRSVWRVFDKVLVDLKLFVFVIFIIILDLFGFLWGVIVVCVFFNYLIEWVGDYKLQVCGILLRVCFMGLFDMVVLVEIVDFMLCLGDGYLVWVSL